MKYGLALALCLYSHLCHAIPIEWTLQGVEFGENGVNGTASGSFVYDADTNTFSEVSVVTTPGVTIPGNSYSDVCLDFFICSSTFIAFDLSADDNELLNALIFTLDGEMTNAGGTLGIVTGDACSVSCEFGQILFDFRSVTSGSITAVPIPAPALLFGSGLIGMVLVRLKLAA